MEVVEVVAAAGAAEVEARLLLYVSGVGKEG